MPRFSILSIAVVLSALMACPAEQPCPESMQKEFKQLSEDANKNVRQQGMVLLFSCNQSNQAARAPLITTQDKIYVNVPGRKEMYVVPYGTKEFTGGLFNFSIKDDKVTTEGWSGHLEGCSHSEGYMYVDFYIHWDSWDCNCTGVSEKESAGAMKQANETVFRFCDSAGYISPVTDLK